MPSEKIEFDKMDFYQLKSAVFKHKEKHQEILDEARKRVCGKALEEWQFREIFFSMEDRNSLNIPFISVGEIFFETLYESLEYPYSWDSTKEAEDPNFNTVVNCLRTLHNRSIHTLNLPGSEPEDSEELASIKSKLINALGKIQLNAPSAAYDRIKQIVTPGLIIMRPPPTLTVSPLSMLSISALKKALKEESYTEESMREIAKTIASSTLNPNLGEEKEEISKYLSQKIGSAVTPIVFSNEQPSTFHDLPADSNMDKASVSQGQKKQDEFNSPKIFKKIVGTKDNLKPFVDLLERYPPGTWLIRESSIDGNVTVTYKLDSGVYHQRFAFSAELSGYDQLLASISANLHLDLNKQIFPEKDLVLVDVMDLSNPMQKVEIKSLADSSIIMPITDQPASQINELLKKDEQPKILKTEDNEGFMSFEKVLNEERGYYYNPELNMPQPSAQAEKPQYKAEVHTHLTNSAIDAINTIIAEVKGTGLAEAERCANRMNTMAQVYYNTTLSIQKTLRQLTAISTDFPEYKSYIDKMAAVIKAEDANLLGLDAFIDEQFSKLEHKEVEAEADTNPQKAISAGKTEQKSEKTIDHNGETKRFHLEHSLIRDGVKILSDDELATTDSELLGSPISPSLNARQDKDKIIDSESNVIDDEEAILGKNLRRTAALIEKLLNIEVKVSVKLKSLDKSAFVLVTAPSVSFVLPTNLKSKAKALAIIEALKAYQKPEETPWFNVSPKEFFRITYIEITPNLEGNLKNRPLPEDFEERLMQSYHQHLLNIYIRDHLNFEVLIPVDEQGTPKIQFQITNRRSHPEDKAHAEQLSAINLALKEAGLNFRRDDNDPSLFAPVPGLKTTMMEKDVLAKFVESYQKNHTFLQQAKSKLLANRTGWEAVVDWLQDHPKTTFGLTVLGYILAIIPGIVLTVTYFDGINSTKRVNNFITAFGKGDDNYWEARSAIAAFPSESMKTIASAIIQEHFNSLQEPPLTSAPPVQRPKDFASILSPGQLQPSIEQSSEVSSKLTLGKKVN